MDNRCDSRDGGVCFDLGVATLSPEKLLELLPFPHPEARYNGMKTHLVVVTGHSVT